MIYNIWKYRRGEKAFQQWLESMQQWRKYCEDVRQAHSRYAHEPLGDPDLKKMRLMELLPHECSDGSNAPIRIRIRTSSLRDSNIEPYEAVSYVWGDTTHLCPVFCDDAVMWTTENLYRALHRLRKKDAVRILWADAICINQSDLREKNWQVRQMADVYHNAERVLICLGEESDDSEVLQEFIPRLIRAKELMETAGVSNDVYHLSAAQRKTFHIPSRLDLTPYRALIAVTHRDWFQRVWIIQEYVLAREALLICGDWEIPWSSFSAAYNFANERFLLALVHGNVAASAQYQRLFSLKHAWANEPYGWVLGDLLVRFRSASATNPLDYVFALVGVAQDGDKFDIDYTKSLSEDLRKLPDTY